MKMKMKTETHQISDQPASSSCSCKLNVLCTPQDVDSRCRCAAVSSIDREYAVEMRICQQQPERPCDAAVHGCRNCRRSRVTSSLVQRPAVLEVPATLRGFVSDGAGHSRPLRSLNFFFPFVNLVFTTTSQRRKTSHLPRKNARQTPAAQASTTIDRSPR